jgi:3',5'-cyclic-AMP phosphodiesterase
MGIRFAHISDLHVLAEPVLQYGVDTAALLQTAVDALNRLRPDVVVASGDLVSDASEASYRRLRDLLRPLASPIHFLMGNHDDRSAFRRVFRPGEPADERPVVEAFSAGGLRFVLLDSSLPGKEEGRLGPAQLAWLRGEMAADSDERVWVFLHHQPLPIRIAWLDRIGLLDADEFLAAVADHARLAGICYGHVHQPRSWRYDGALYLGAPALSFQFSTVSQSMAIGREEPAFRLIEVAGHDIRRTLHYLDGRAVPEPEVPALPVYVRGG